jgi:integral membrane sensor domain MASE1
MKRKIAFALLMGIITTAIVSFTLVAVNVGFSARFLPVWLRSWVIAYLVVIPVILVISPALQKMTDRYFDR